MAPTLTPIDYAQAQMMNSGTFTLFHAWDLGDGCKLEYWRGISRNGACIRRLYDGHTISVAHYPEPCRAIQSLMQEGCQVPGVAA